MNAVNNLSDPPPIKIAVNSKYIYPDELKKDKTFKVSKLTLLHYNIRSLPKHHDDFSNYLSYQNINFDIVVLSETFLNNHNKDNYPIPGYYGTHLIRNDKRGGGVSIYIRNEFCNKVKIITSIQNDIIEALAIQINTKQIKQHIVGIYRPPNSSRNDFIQALNTLIQTRLNNSNVLIAGDFNIDMLNKNPSLGATPLQNLMTSHGFINYITQPTRPNNIENRNPTLLDHIWGNLNCNMNSFIIQTDLTDHFPCLVQWNINKTNNLTTIKYREDKETNDVIFIDKVKEIDFSSIYNEQIDIDSRFSTLINQIYRCYHETFQIKTKQLGCKRVQNPWLTPGLLNSIDQKHKLYRNYKRGIIPFQLYNNYSNQLKALLKKAKRKYYTNKFGEVNNNSKATWSLINNLINKNKEHTHKINQLSINDEVSTDKKKIADSLNSYFINIGTEILTNSSASQTNPETFLPQCNSHFTFENITPVDVQTIIEGLKNKKCDILSVPNHKYKLVADIISAPLAHLFNVSTLSGIFPSTLKISRVTPIFKKDDPSLPKNYRPISITHTISKIFEKIVFKQLTEYLNSNSLLSDFQFGFRKGRSTSDALICLTEKLYKNLENKDASALLLLDFTKAFDTIDHNILLTKLKRLGFDGLNLQWFETYLKGRQQYVQLDDISSNTQQIKTGVPQGSILGPLLFSIYTNDLINSHNSFSVSFADDISIVINDKNPETLSKKAEASLTNIMKWVDSNKLSLNIQKTSYIIISNKNVGNNFKIKLKDIELTRSNTAKILGVIIDEKLTFKDHINSLVNKLAKYMYILVKLAKSIPLYVLRKIYFAHIHPHLLYCLPVYGSTTKSNTHQIITMQKRIIRLLSGSRDFYCHTPPLFKKLNILQFDHLLNLSLLKEIHKVINNNTCEFLQTNHLINQTEREIILRNNTNLQTPFYRLTKARQAVSYVSTILYNSLPDDIKNERSIKSYARKIKKMFINSY